MIGDNLRFMLAPYSPEHSIYFGYKFNISVHKWGYFSGGAGYVMSWSTIRTFVERVLVARRFFEDDETHKNNIYDGRCHLETDERIEDVEITTCLDHFNVYAGDGRDLVKRERFHMWQPEFNLLTAPNFEQWYWTRKYYWSDEGLDCCSNYSISFHYIQAKNKYTMYLLSHSSIEIIWNLTTISTTTEKI